MTEFITSLSLGASTLDRILQSVHSRETGLNFHHLVAGMKYVTLLLNIFVLLCFLNLLLNENNFLTMKPNYSFVALLTNEKEPT